MKKPAQTKSDSLRIVVVFCLVVLLLIVTSLSYKFFLLLRTSTFDGSHRHTIALIHSSKQLEVISFEPETTSISHVVLTSRQKMPSPEIMLGIPIDGKIYDDQIVKGEDIAQKISRQIYRFGGDRQHLTIIDLIRLSLFAGSVPDRDITKKVIEYSENPIALEQLFYDQSIVDEEISIEIVNATGVTGLGGRVERLLSNMGASVVSVTTSPSPESQSRIRYFGESTYTLKRIAKILNFPNEQVEDKTISDIIIILGKDSVKSTKF